MTQKALLVGINDYAPVGPGGPDLRGCVNDVRDMAHTLNVLGVIPASPASMRILTDARATRKAILDGFKWLLDGAKKGDVLIFYYSGHGSQMIDPSGEEPDGKDETICPHDYATAGMIKDDDFRTLLAPLPDTVNLDIFFDSCHSGTATRALPPAFGNDEDQYRGNRYIEPPVDWGYFIDANPSLPLKNILRPNQIERAAAKQAVAVPKLNHVLWAGCRDYQTSAEQMIAGSVRGAYTYYLCQAMRKAGLGISRRRLDSLVSADLAKNGFAQVPQLEGTKTALNQKLFT